MNKYDETNVNKNDLLVNYLLEIYNDINIDENFKNIDKYFKNINIVKDEEEIELFYMSEIKLEEYINNFNNKFILTQNITIDIYIWFKELNKVLNYAKILNMEKLFNSEQIISTIDKYIENNKNIKPFDIMKKIMLKDSENYNTIKAYVDYFNKKAYLQYCNNLIDQINSNIKNLIYDKEKLNELFNLFNDEENVNKSVIFSKIKENNFFIIDLNKEINYESWSWCHKIWRNIGIYYGDNQDFKNYIIKILETSSKIGRYRIESLNKQYNINL